MPLPSKEEALRRIHQLAGEEKLKVSRRAATQMDGLGYTDPDVCDMLYELTTEDCEKLEKSHWNADVPVGTFRATFCSRRREEDGHQPDELFVEVVIKDDELYLLAC